MSEPATTEANVPVNAPTPEAAAPAQAQAQTRLDEVKTTARKVWADVRGLSVRAQAEAREVTTRGRQRWSTLVPRAREVSARTRTRVVTAWQEQVTGARAGVARVKAALGKRA